MKNKLKNKIKTVEIATSSFLRIRTLITFVIMAVFINAGITAGINGIIPGPEGDTTVPGSVDDLKQVLQLECSYMFQTLSPIETEHGTVITIEGLDLYAHPGEPIVPMKTVKLLLPMGKDIEIIDVDSGHGFLLPRTFIIAPGQHPIPLSYAGPIPVTEPDPEIYNSETMFPGDFYRVVSLQRSHGFTILVLNLFPLQYIPKTGEVYYYTKLDLKLTLMPSSTNLDNTIRRCRMLQNDINHVQNMVDNPEMIATYSPQSSQKIDRSDMSPLSPADNYTYVVITNEALRDADANYTFQDLIQSKIDKGMTATLVTVEEIEACPDYWWDGAFGDGDPLYNDTACHIRNFIKDADENWNTSYVLLGGDGDGADVGGESGDDIIPARILFDPLYPYESPPSDLYYACLDGSFDSNLNGIFGEPNDGLDGNEIDLLAEVYIGRAPVDNAEELSNFVRKTLAYENSDGDEYLRAVWMIGEHLGFGGYGEYGGYAKDEIKDGSGNHGYTTLGIPDLFNVSTLYDRDWPGNDWPKTELINIINNGTHLLNHLGHGNNFRVMKLYEPVKPLSSDTFVPCHDVVENLTNNQYFFGYSQACFPGSFDNKWPDPWGGQYLENDSIIEYLIGAPHGAFAFIANTRYGLGQFTSTNGPSQHYDREFFDALFGENKRNLGKANQDSKEDNIGKLDNLGMRLCYLEITLFGDPELAIKDPPLRDHDLSVMEIDAPDHIWIDTGTYINATICNLGLNDEANILVNLSIDNTSIESQSISMLPSGEQTTVSYYWSNSTLGTYEIQVEVKQVPGENYIINNIKTKLISLISSPVIKICLLDGIMTDFWLGPYQNLNNNWFEYGDIPVEIDYWTLNKDDITYEDINATDADVLVIHGSMPNEAFLWEFSLEELTAITQYVQEGHGLLIIWDTFGGNNDILLPYVGLSEGAEQGNYYVGGSGLYELEIFEEDHPLFSNMPNPTPMRMSTVMPQDDIWDENELGTGRYVGKMEDEIAAIVVNTNNAVYISMTLEYIDCYYNMQLLYNAIVFTSVPSGPTDFYILAGGPYDGFIGESLQFFGFASGGNPPYNWSWDFGDGNTSDDQYPAHTYSELGNFTVTLNVTDSEGYSSEDTTWAEIVTLVVDAGGPYPGFLLGSEINFNGSAYGIFPPYNWSWDFGDGNTSDEQNPVHTYGEPGIFTVILNVTDSGGYSSEDTTWAEIAVLIVGAHGPYSGYLGEAIDFSGSVYGGNPPYNWSWDFGDGNTSDEQNPVHIYNETGIFTVMLNVTDSEGYSDDDLTTVTIEVGELVADAHGPYEGLLDEPIQFTGSATGGIPSTYSWHWDFGDGNTSDEQNPTHNYSELSIYTVNLTVTDSEGNIDNDTTTVVIHPWLVWVDDDFNESTPGWGYDHFDIIQGGIDMVAEHGTVHVFNGIYYENIVIGESITLIGEDRNMTVIDGGGSGTVVGISADGVTICGFTIQNSRCPPPPQPSIPPSAMKISSNSNTVSGNIILNNDYGIYLLAASDNIITENTIISNSYNGIYLQRDLLGGSSNNNLIYHNNFINNSQQAYDRCTNMWDNGYPSGGNYWDNYNGSDSCSGPDQNESGADGIGDTPYDIPGGSNQDRYPLMCPWPWVAGDLDHDGDVDLSDLAQLLAHYGMTSGATYEDGDIDGDGDVDFSDLVMLLVNYGTGT